MFTIGYATKSIHTYTDQLKYHGVNVVVDIRSVPYSKVFHDYNRETLRKTLRKEGVRYIDLGKELGPRSKDPCHYNEENQVQFDRLMDSDLFKSGIQRLFEGLEKGFTIALNCAEKNPATCHRSLLVGWSLKHQYQHELEHILHDGALRSQSDLEYQLMALTNTSEDLFTNENQALQLAYDRQCAAFAYRIPDKELQ